MDEGDGRVQTIYVDNGEGTLKQTLVSRRYLTNEQREQKS
jgi:hypothetical protein